MDELILFYMISDFYAELSLLLLLLLVFNLSFSNDGVDLSKPDLLIILILLFVESDVSSILSDVDRSFKIGIFYLDNIIMYFL
jgi:hypothetical protein